MTGEYGTNQQVALNNANDLFGRALPSSSTNHLGQYDAATYNHYLSNHWPFYYQAVIAPGHRVCSCPNCAGDCCICADCKVKRLEKRVAELEAGKE